MRGIQPEVPVIPYHDRIQEEEIGAERAREAEGHGEYDAIRETSTTAGRGRWLGSLLVALSIGAILAVGYLLAAYLFSL